MSDTCVSYEGPERSFKEKLADALYRVEMGAYSGCQQLNNLDHGEILIEMLRTVGLQIVPLKVFKICPDQHIKVVSVEEENE